MAELTDAQRKRKEAREQRRRKSEPEQTAEDGSGAQPLDAVKNAAKVAAAGAAVGAAAAAARALGSKHEEDSEGEPEAEETAEEEHSEPQRQGEQEQEEPRVEKPRAEEPSGEPADQEEQEQHQEDERREEPVEGEALGDARNAAARAKEHLEELLGKPAESVSALERTHDGWVVVLEVVELQRIPESTDVLASYELELDDNLNFRRYQQARRYNRSQGNRGEEA